ncbi:N-acetylmuramic acid 6-phosphate etherase [Okibacterium sp. HSC-33S16]|uniref:N-acetylmuramic acid 6-phosphate etherase n=1 Tax=Okibacterium sp. HSC-33S16 TaxID=2910965 RepID=UPI00209E6E0C|nr:N-acetylmuramic acid 6-phosphate etherase [Okibacterium sp. HSC-33S16]MCP2031024.1 N-acetylmuramic acid 6-phosphate etherase [Okibacterium sp. HSC-33S16]
MAEPRFPELIAIGETMVVIAPTTAEPLETATDFSLGAGGAESNVAIHAAGLGVAAGWVSAVGNDALGRRLTRQVSERGVDCRWLAVHPTAPTGVYFKDPGAGVLYYRGGSAASRMSPAALEQIPLEQASVVHLSGITAALSESCSALLDAVLERLAGTDVLVSFDVNFRQGLWDAAMAAGRLRELAQRADLVFVGLDEAETLWGTTTAEEVRRLLDAPDRLVVKDGHVGATEFSRAGAVFVPATPTEVLEAVGAGDAFAGGYLAAHLAGADAGERLAAGHRQAVLALTTHGDVPDALELSGAADPTGSGDTADLHSELSQLSTEAVNDKLRDLDLRSTLEMATAMNAGDHEVADAVAAVTPAIAVAVDDIVERLTAGGRLIYLGAGTSGRLGVLDASEIPPTFGTDADRVIGIIAGGPIAITSAVEGAEDDEAAGANDLDAIDLGPTDVVVGLSASGRTPYVIGALAFANARGALTIAVSCNRASRIGALATHPLDVVVGGEFIAGSTRLKAGTAQKLVLNMISTLTMVRLGKTFGNVMVDLRVSNEKLRARAERTIMSVTDASSDRAAAALDAAGGSVKEAILALRTELGPDDARRLLAEHQGFLRAALDAATTREGARTRPAASVPEKRTTL